jgi:ubiquinone/menaquinone biosynthesis C-methylase UbiE
MDRNRRSRLFELIRGFLRDQFGRPNGFWGVVAGRIMANTPSNHERSRWTISMLDIQPSDRILEIGFGPGIAIDMASRLATKGFVAGVDHSDVMLRQAARRNAKAIRAGRAGLWLGSASELPNFDQRFDKIFTVNSIHFWAEPVECLARLRAILKPSGMIAVVLQPRARAATQETARTVGQEIVANLERAGFSNCRLKIKQNVAGPIVCATGMR